MSKKLLRTISEELNDDVIVEVLEKEHREAYLILPDLQISDKGSIQSLKVRAYSAEVNNDGLLHKLFGKVREKELKPLEEVGQ
jgi:hypothetical protein